MTLGDAPPTERLAIWAPPLACARPFVARLENGPDKDLFELTQAAPGDCAQAFRSGCADVALVSSACFWRLAREPGLDDVRIVPHVAISVHGSFPSEVADEHCLGDIAGTVAEWRARSGLPFVSWLWVARAGAVNEPHLAGLFRRLSTALADVPVTVAAVASGASGASAESLRYELGSHELSGLAAFVEELHRTSGLPSTDRPSLRIRLLDFDLLGLPLARPSRKVSGKTSIDGLLADAASGARIAPADAALLYERASLLDLGEAADRRRRALHPENVVTYIIDRNVNYTNVCVTACKFCNFFRPEKSRDGYTLSREDLAQKFAETVALGGIQILLQGGVNPHLPLAYYEDLFHWTKTSFPLALHALSPEEVSFIARQESLSIATVLERLIAAGLDSLPGGGAEILDDDIRRRISPLKCSTDTWLEVMRQAHRLGLRTTATLVFGFGETPEQMVGHLERLRALQDVTAGFTAFICWPFQAEGTRLRLGDDTTALRYLRIFSLARLYLDNFPNLQVSWPTMGPTIGQVALRFGGNDFGSAMIEENVVSQAGAVFKLSAADIEERVLAAGFVPRRRNMRYELLSSHASVVGKSPAMAVAKPVGLLASA
jgi:cyclic dehypoxanthinyl futalosine synthase